MAGGTYVCWEEVLMDAENRGGCWRRDVGVFTGYGTFYRYYSLCSYKLTTTSNSYERSDEPNRMDGWMNEFVLSSLSTSYHLGLQSK